MSKAIMALFSNPHRENSPSHIYPPITPSLLDLTTAKVFQPEHMLSYNALRCIQHWTDGGE